MNYSPFFEACGLTECENDNEGVNEENASMLQLMNLSELDDSKDDEHQPYSISSLRCSTVQCVILVHATH
jgi:hypothetical protein